MGYIKTVAIAIHTCTQHVFKSHFNKTHVQVLHVHCTMGKSNPGHNHN